MPICLKFTLLVLLFFATASESFGICKWVDEKGVVHYAETCPEDVDSSDVPIEPPPPQEQIDETTLRAEKLRSEAKARHEQQEREKEQEALEYMELEKTSDTMNSRCAEARWNLEILRKQLPVYYDENNELHYNRSLHHYWYEGQRTYLDDQQRAAEISRYAMVEAQTCTGSESDIRDRIIMYMEKRDAEICKHLRIKLAKMKELNTGIPSGEMRELEQTIATRCR